MEKRNKARSSGICIESCFSFWKLWKWKNIFREGIFWETQSFTFKGKTFSSYLSHYRCFSFESIYSLSSRQLFNLSRVESVELWTSSNFSVFLFNTFNFIISKSRVLQNEEEEKKNFSLFFFYKEKSLCVWTNMNEIPRNLFIRTLASLCTSSGFGINQFFISRFTSNTLHLNFNV